MIKTFLMTVLVFTLILGESAGITSYTGNDDPLAGDTFAQEGEQDDELPAGLEGFCEEHPGETVRDRSTDTEYNCAELFPTFEVVEEEDEGFEIVDDDSSSTAGDWEIVDINLDDDPIVESWLSRLDTPAPELWSTFPNVDNPDVPDFEVANSGVEYGMADSPFCERDSTCDLVVPGWHYRLITGDYVFTGGDQFEDRSCTGSERQGCMLLLINVGESTYTWRDQRVDNGFTVMGRYWNGEYLDEAVWALVSHSSANMLNFRTYSSGDRTEILNEGLGSTNAGANCGNIDGCLSVDVLLVVHAEERIIATAATTVGRE